MATFVPLSVCFASLLRLLRVVGFSGARVPASKRTCAHVSCDVTLPPLALLLLHIQYTGTDYACIHALLARGRTIMLAYYYLYPPFPPDDDPLLFPVVPVLFLKKV